MKLIEIYRSILKFAGLEADDQGFISTVLDDRREPALINGARMVLPLDYQLKNFNPQEKMIFHPMTENILRGESDVIQKLKSVINIRLNFTTGIVAQSLLNLVASGEYHSKLNPEQAELLVAIKDADEKTVLNFISQMVSGIKSRPDNLFTNIYIKRGGNYHGERFARVGIVSFPFYSEVISGKLDKVRVKDKEAYADLFRFIFPNLENHEEYNFGSSSHVAPYLESLMRTAANVASRLNDIILLYQDYIEDAEKLMFDAEWLEHFDNLDALLPEIRKIPVQSGNDGNIVQDEPAPMQAQTPMAPPMPMYPNQAPQQYMVPQQMPPKPEIKQTKRGLDFKSVMQNNPSVAYAPNPLVPQMMQQAAMAQMMQQANRRPGWDQPQMQQQQMPPINTVFMTPNGPMIMTPNGPMPYQQQPPPMNYGVQPMMPMNQGWPNQFGR